jgi:hypothetical protein
MSLKQLYYIFFYLTLVTLNFDKPKSWPNMILVGQILEAMRANIYKKKN